jgi:hypothetical protein
MTDMIDLEKLKIAMKDAKASEIFEAMEKVIPSEMSPLRDMLNDSIGGDYMDHGDYD